ncbi:hypothetical protein Tco_0825959 [Tanacetum coccineum]
MLIFALPGHGNTSSVGRKSNAIFALPGHGSTSSVGRKSNAIFALPGHKSTSSVGRKSNAIFALPGHGSTSSVGRKSNAIFALPGHKSTSSVGRKSNAIFALSGHGIAAISASTLEETVATCPDHIVGAKAKAVAKRKASTKSQEPSNATKKVRLVKKSSEAGFSKPSNEEGDEIGEILSIVQVCSISHESRVSIGGPPSEGFNQKSRSEVHLLPTTVSIRVLRSEVRTSVSSGGNVWRIKVSIGSFSLLNESNHLERPEVSSSSKVQPEQSMVQPEIRDDTDADSNATLELVYIKDSQVSADENDDGHISIIPFQTFVQGTG